MLSELMSSEEFFEYTGKFIRVDLSEKLISYETCDEETLRKYLGGTGIGAKIIYDEVPPEAEFYDSRNRIVIAGGPLSATAVPSSGGFSVVTKGALTNGGTSTQANGFFGAFLKLSGFDGIIVQGKSREWVYLYIENGTAELRNASSLVGKGAEETEDVIRKELGKSEDQMSVASIGPAGENLVRFAGITVDNSHASAHNGTGAVMGSKKLKAIAVTRGNIPPKICDKKGLSAVAREIAKQAVTKNVDCFKYGDLWILPWQVKHGALPIKNYSTGVWSIKEEELAAFEPDAIRTRFRSKRNPCWRCPMHHKEKITLTEEPYAGKVVGLPSYEMLTAFSCNIGNTDVHSAIVLSYLTDNLGLEGTEASFVISWVMECYEKGILTKEDTDGLEMTWGNVAATKKMLEKISKREGFGDLLAEGIMRASQKIGGKATDLAVFNEKGNSTRTSADHRYKWWELFDTCVSNTSTIETYPMPRDLGLPELYGPIRPLEIPAAQAKYKANFIIEDSLGVCSYVTLGDLTLLAKAISATTGWNFKPEEADEAGRRFVNLLRAFNVRCGITPDQEHPSLRYSSTPADGPAKGKSIMPHWEQMLDKYYKLMGWDRETGKPLPEVLKRLDLGFVIKDLWGNEKA
jgi:aldehyde:ferredoxin oxidoreductase